MINDKKKFPPIFWVAFAILVVLNLSVFIDYQQPLDRYQPFTRIAHDVDLKPGSVLKKVTRGGQLLEQCTIASGGTLQWLSFADGYVRYQFMPQSAATSDKSNQDVMCQANDLVSVNATSEDNHNTQLVLLSIDFNKPLKG